MLRIVLYQCFRVNQAVFRAENYPAIPEQLGVLAIHFERRAGVRFNCRSVTEMRATIPDLRQRRELSRLGWTVLAFTGSEITADPGSCVEQIIRTVTARRR